MAEGEKTYTIDILGAKHTVSGAELDALLARDTQGLIEIEGEGADSFYTTEAGEVGRAPLTATQLRNRKAIGEENVYLGEGDPKEEVWEQNQQYRADVEKGKGGLRSLYTFGRGFVPGIQFAENAIMGEGDATYFRQTSIAARPFTNVVGQVAGFFTLGKAAKKLLAGTPVAKHIMATRSTVLGKTAQLAGEDVLLESYLYTNSILNNNQDFIVEDLSEQVGEGLIFASPFIGNYIARHSIGVAGRVSMDYLKGGIPGVGGAAGVLDYAAMGLVTKGLSQGGQAAGKTMRRAAQVRLAERVFRRMGRGAAKNTTVPGVADDVLANFDKEFDEIKGFTPEYIIGAKSMAARRTRLTRLGELAGTPLDDIDIQTIGKSRRIVGQANTKINKVRGDLLRLNKTLKKPASILDETGAKRAPQDMVEPPKWEGFDDSVYTFHVENALDELHTAGFGDIAGNLENTVHMADPEEAFRAWVQRKLDARLKAVTGESGFESLAGASRAEEIITRVLKSEEVWQNPNTAARGAIISDAIEQMADSWNEAIKIGHRIPDKFDEIGAREISELNRADAMFDEVRSGYNQLRQQKILSNTQVEALETSLTDAQRAVADARAQYVQFAKINAAKRTAETVHEAKVIDYHKVAAKSEPEVAEDVQRSAVEGGTMMVALGDTARKVFRGLESTKFWRHTAFGVAAMRTVASEKEKREMYAVVSDRLRELAGNPAALESGLSEVTKAYGQAAPYAVQPIQARSAETILYLSQHLPRPVRSMSGRDFPIHIAKIEGFLDKFASAYEPVSVGILALSGQITPPMVETVKRTNPAIYSEMYSVLSSELAELSPEEYRKMPRETMMGLQIFMGGITSATEGYNLMQLQSNYTQTAQEQQAVYGGSTGNTLSNPGPQDPSSPYTSTQRIMGY